MVTDRAQPLDAVPAVGVDVGGTFTDCVIIDPAEQTIRISKVSSTPDDQSAGLVEAVAQAWPNEDWTFDPLIHGTTVATNAVLERRGRPVALVTTQGFGDVLEMRRRDRPHLYGLTGEYRPIVPRAHVYEITERITSTGGVESRVRSTELSTIANDIAQKGFETVVVSLLNAYANPENELYARDQLRSLLPDSVSVIAASTLTREYREFERTSTAAVSAYVQPLISGYLHSLDRRVRDRSYGGEIWIVQSNGGRMSLSVASEYAANTILSGPAAGVVAGRDIAQSVGYENVVTMDMGGTSLDVGVVFDGQIAMTAESLIEFGIPLRLPMVDVHTIGAGGGSIAHIDAQGLLAVGPRSAGAVPGPACYGRGGAEPTLTDANVVLQRIGEGQQLGSDSSALHVDRALARTALSTHLGDAVEGGAEQIAQSVVDVAVNTIAEAIRLVTVERGLDPKEFVLTAFGGAGPLHVCAVMEAVGFKKALVPRLPGITSALGCIVGNVRHDFVQTIDRPLDELTEETLDRVVRSHVTNVRKLLARERIDADAIRVAVEADMNYERQTHTVAVPLVDRSLAPEKVRRAFEETYERRFGRLFTKSSVVLVNLKTSVIAPGRPIPSEGFRLVSDGPSAAAGNGAEPTHVRHREVFFGGEPVACRVYTRATLVVGEEVVGPAVIDQDDATCVIEPGFYATVDSHLNLVVEGRSASSE